MEAIRFIGMGRMGLPMCANLVAAGYEVTTSDASPQARERRSALWGTWRDRPAEAAPGADLVITGRQGPERSVR